MMRTKCFHCCDSCKGLFSVKSALFRHQPTCDTLIQNSTAGIFAVDKTLLLSCLSAALATNQNILHKMDELSLLDLDIISRVQSCSIERNFVCTSQDEARGISTFSDQDSVLPKLEGNKIDENSDRDQSDEKTDIIEPSLSEVLLSTKFSDPANNKKILIIVNSEVLDYQDNSKESHDEVVLTDAIAANTSTSDNMGYDVLDLRTENTNLDNDVMLNVKMEEGLEDSDTKGDTAAAEFSRSSSRMKDDCAMIIDNKNMGGHSSKNMKNTKASNISIATHKMKEWKAKQDVWLEKYTDNVIKTGYNGTNTYQCSYCQWTTTKVGMFDRHVRTMHSQSGLFKCEQCNYSSDSKVTYRHHTYRHNKKLLCDICAEVFDTQKNLQRHRWKHTGEKPFKCDLCSYSTRFSEQMTIHKRRHTGERLHCTVKGCNFSTMYPWALKTHKDSQHSEQFKFICDQCPYKTSCQYSFTVHQKNHLGIKQFQCSYCDYKAVTKGAVLRHLSKHTNEKRYFCDQCNYASPHHSAFRLHMMSHFDLKCFQCSSCGYKSIMKSKVQRHIATKSSCNFTGAEVIYQEGDFKLNMKKYLRPRERTGVYEHVTEVVEVLETSFASQNLEVINKDSNEQRNSLLSKKLVEEPEQSLSVIATGADFTESKLDMVGSDVEVMFLDSDAVVTDMDQVIIVSQPLEETGSTELVMDYEEHENNTYIKQSLEINTPEVESEEVIHPQTVGTMYL